MVCFCFCQHWSFQKVKPNPYVTLKAQICLWVLKFSLRNLQAKMILSPCLARVTSVTCQASNLMRAVWVALKSLPIGVPNITFLLVLKQSCLRTRVTLPLCLKCNRPWWAPGEHLSGCLLLVTLKQTKFLSSLVKPSLLQKMYWQETAFQVPKMPSLYFLLAKVMEITHSNGQITYQILFGLHYF